MLYFTELFADLSYFLEPSNGRFDTPTINHSGEINEPTTTICTDFRH